MTGTDAKDEDVEMRGPSPGVLGLLYSFRGTVSDVAFVNC